MIPEGTLQEGILPSFDQRRQILERARQVLLQARMVTGELDQLRRGLHGEGSTQRFSVNSPREHRRSNLPAQSKVRRAAQYQPPAIV